MPVAHSPDFRTVNWFGVVHHFTPTQARIVECLWSAWEQGTPALSYAYIKTYLAASCESECLRVRDLFRRGGRCHPAWGSMIVRGPTRGSLMLAVALCPPVYPQSDSLQEPQQ